MDNVQNCDSYINIPSSQTYRSCVLRISYGVDTSSNITGKCNEVPYKWIVVSIRPPQGIGQRCLTGPQFGNHYSCTNVAVSYCATKLLLDLVLNRGRQVVTNCDQQLKQYPGLSSKTRHSVREEILTCGVSIF
jgi:hypothetical protein